MGRAAMSRPIRARMAAFQLRSDACMTRIRICLSVLACDASVSLHTSGAGRRAMVALALAWRCAAAARGCTRRPLSHQSDEASGPPPQPLNISHWTSHAPAPSSWPFAPRAMDTTQQALKQQRDERTATESRVSDRAAQRRAAQRQPVGRERRRPVGGRSRPPPLTPMSPSTKTRASVHLMLVWDSWTIYGVLVRSPR